MSAIGRRRNIAAVMCCWAMLLQLSFVRSLADASCADLGFTGFQTCSSCDSLAEYVKDEGLVAECKRCCVADEDSTSQKYNKATLVVCPYRINTLEEIKNFVDKHATSFNKLQVKFKYGAHPKLILSNEDEEQKDTIRIDNWTAESISQYLTDKLA